jgi:hypothetical protein
VFDVWFALTDAAMIWWWSWAPGRTCARASSCSSSVPRGSSLPAGRIVFCLVWTWLQSRPRFRLLGTWPIRFVAPDSRSTLFVDETPAFDVAYEEADLFVVVPPDPLPNVAIDALQCMPVLCREGQRIAEFPQASGLGDCCRPIPDSADLADKAGPAALSRGVAKSGRGRDASVSFFNMERMRASHRAGATGCRPVFVRKRIWT